MTQRSRRFVVIGGLLVLAAVLTVLWVYRRIDDTVRDSYAVWWVANMVIEHMEQHEGAWPRDWNALSAPYDRCVERSGKPWSLESLRNRVAVDFTADPAELVEGRQVEGKPAFRVVYLRDGDTHHWESHEPNQMILDYLTEKLNDNGISNDSLVTPHGID